MPSIPLPFVVSLVLCLALVRMTRQRNRQFGLFTLLVATFAFQAILSGLNWNVGWHAARLVQPVVAAVIPALCFAAFDQLRRNNGARSSDLWLHLLPAGVVAVLVAFWRAPIDIVLFAVCLGYGVALLRIAQQGPGALAAVRITDEETAYKALVVVAVLLVLTAFIDATVSLDLVLGDGQQAPALLTVASVIWLAVAGYAATVADGARPDPESDAAEGSSALPACDPEKRRSSSSSAEDVDMTSRIDALMRGQHLYRDPDLTLERLARRAGIPGRQISGAMNRIYGRNISQIVNEYRVDDAKRRLVETSDPVIVIMLESGFGTKSNFNREFLRVTGMTPRDYRRAGGEAAIAAEVPTKPPLSP